MLRLVSPEARLKVIKLRTESKMTYKTIAARMGISESTVAVILREAAQGLAAGQKPVPKGE